MPFFPSTPIPLLLAVAALVACGGGEDAPTVMGSVTVAIDDTVTGFRFDEPTRIEDDRVAAGDGRLAGHCTFSEPREGEPDRVSVGVMRTDGDDDLGLREIRVAVDEEGRGSTGYVRADVGGQLYLAEGLPADTCRVAPLYLDRGAARAQVAVDCEVPGPDGVPAVVEADLEFAGCD
ncbi:MAG: hypothetical protein ACOCV4_07550 [Myxococcota bacterium]